MKRKLIPYVALLAKSFVASDRKTITEGKKTMPETPTFGRYAEIPYDRMTPEQFYFKSLP